MKRIPQIYEPEKLVDIAFRRASKEARKVQNKIPSLRKKKAEERRVKECANYITSYLASFESLRKKIEELPSFYHELLGITFDAKMLSDSFDRLAWAQQTIAKMEVKSRKRIRMRTKDPVVLRKEFYGKTSSILNKLKLEFKNFQDLCETLKNFPTIEEGFTVVIAGMPNVGKSSILRQLTSSTPQIRTYPFTTKNILVGYMEIGYRRVQIIDTPGILDRPIEKRNPIEKKAILALEHLASVILFVFDPTATCGFPLESQIELYRELEDTFRYVMPVANKTDLTDTADLALIEKTIGKTVLRCSALLGEVDEVYNFILQSREKDI